MLLVFAASNYRREKQMMTEALLQKGQSLIQAVQTGVRVSLRASLQAGGNGRLQFIEHVQAVLGQMQEDSDVHAVFLVDGSGAVLASSDEATPAAAAFDTPTLDFLRLAKPGQIAYRMAWRQAPDGIFQVALKYRPGLHLLPPRHLPDVGRSANSMRRMHSRMMERFFEEPAQQPHLLEELQQLEARQLSLLVELKLDKFNAAVKRQFLQIVGLTLSLLLAGIGGWLSLLTVQGWKSSQQRLGRMRAFNDILVHSLPVGLISTDSQGLVQTVNRQAERILATSAAELSGKTPDSCLPPILAECLHFTGANATAASRESLMTGPPGEERHLLLSSLPVQDEQQAFIGMVLLIQDVSDLKLLEKELQRHERLAALGKMAAGVAHELRNPLSSIKGLAVLLKGQLSESVRNVGTADILIQEVERLNRSIGELLDYARPQQLEKSVFSLSETVRKALNLIQPDAKTLAIDVQFHPAPGQDRVSADADKLSQVLLNLFLNAMQAMEQGGRLEVAVRVTDGQVHTTVSDSGEGIAPEVLPKIFDPYFTTKSRGTGLGLALSAKIIEEHGGRIHVTSQPGQGTRVELVLPLALSDQLPVG